MTIVKTYCDKCKKELTEHNTNTIRLLGNDYEFCTNCYGSLVGVLSDWLKVNEDGNDD